MLSLSLKAGGPHSNVLSKTNRHPSAVQVSVGYDAGKMPPEQICRELSPLRRAVWLCLASKVHSQH